MVLDEFVDLSNPSMDSNRQKMYGIMLNFRYTCLQSVHCTCILQDKENFLIIVVWVDDMVGVANTKETNEKFAEKLAAKYKIKVIGEQYMLLGMHITPDYENHTIWLLQTRYIRQILMSSVWRM